MRLLCAILAGLLLGAPAAAESADAPPAPERAVDAGSSLGAERLLAELRQQRRRLEARELEVAAREAAVADLEAEAGRLLDEVEALRGALDRRVAEWESRSESRISRLAKVYGAMSAARAAPLLEGLDLDLATEILSKMKHKQSAQVLALMSNETALRVSRRAARPLDAGLRGADAGPQESSR